MSGLKEKKIELKKIELVEEFKRLCEEKGLHPGRYVEELHAIFQDTAIIDFFGSNNMIGESLVDFIILGDKALYDYEVKKDKRSYLCIVRYESISRIYEMVEESGGKEYVLAVFESTEGSNIISVDVSRKEEIRKFLIRAFKIIFGGGRNEKRNEERCHRGKD